MEVSFWTKFKDIMWPELRMMSTMRHYEELLKRTLELESKLAPRKRSYTRSGYKRYTLK